MLYTFAADVRVALETNWADAVDPVDSLTAFSVGSAFGDVASSLLGAAGLVRVTGSARMTDATVGLSVFAVSVATARRRADGRNDGRHAEQVRFADEKRKADALVGGLVALGAHSASDALAALLTASGDADLRLLTGQRGRADIGRAGATGERVAVVSFEASASGGRSQFGAAGRHDALGVFSAQDVLAEGNTSARLAVFLESGQATAPGCVLFRLAVGVRSAR